MLKQKFLAISIILVMLLSLTGPSFGVAARPLAVQTRVGLGTAASFAVLGATAVTDVPASIITGNVGLSPAAGTNYAGLTTAEVTGTIYAVDSSGPGGVAGNNPGLVNGAQSDLTTAYTNAANETLATNLGVTDNMLGTTLDAGIYSVGHAPTANLTNGQTLTLDGQNDPNAVFVFQLSSDLIMGSTSVVRLINGAQACNVFWQVTSSATLGTGATFVGTILALTSITDNGGSNVQGRLLARNGLVALNKTTVSRPLCSPTIATTLSSTSVAVGSTVHDSATLSGSSLSGTTSDAGGTVTYNYYTNNTCTANAQSAGTVTVTNGVVPDSNAVPFVSAGTYYWQAVYSGDSDNHGDTSACISEALTVNKATPVITTTATGPVAVGQIINDIAHLSGGYGALVGTLTFSVYAPGDTTCTIAIAVVPGITVIGVGDYSSPAFISAATGVYLWRAFYSGDANNNAVSTGCNDTGESSTINQVATQTAIAPTIAPTLTAIAATLTAIPPTRTAIAATLIPTLAPTLTAIAARTPTVTSTPVNVPAVVLPKTGFAPQQVTSLSAQPAAKAYSDLGDLWLEIPRLGVQMAIVGVPQTNGQWDVSWLGNDAGWLNGTAFPTYAGDSVLTGHVYDANGNPGPFVHLNGLWWGDQVIVHAWGAQYIYEVREVLQVSPSATTAGIKHETTPWVTLITCRGYDDASNSYKYRVVVRAVLVDVK